MNTDRVAAVCRAVDAVICWSTSPRWRRGKLITRVKRAYNRPQDQRATDRGVFAHA